jgi:class 3 adenylate cyclase
VLAAPPEVMQAHWTARHGAAWAQRLHRLLEQAHETSVALGFLPAEERWCDDYVGAMALGLSRLAARRLDAEWRGAPDPGHEPRPGAPPPPVEAAGVRFTRRFAGVIFADFAGFSRLNDEELPQFWALFMRAISVRLAVRRNEILLKQTWGDALHLVASTARAAAELACEIQACVEELRPALRGGLAALELRLAAHFAPVYAGHDPVEGAGTYFGTQLSFTARIEPVTPPGMIFVTEAFAAQLALEAPDAFMLEYAGEVRLAKAYGQSRLFSLRPVAAA